MRKRFGLVAMAIMIISVLSASLLLYLALQATYGGSVESITVGNAQSFECDTLIYLAQDHDFFRKNGLNVTVKNYTSGAAAVSDLMKGEVDLAATAEFPLVRRALDGDNISAVCIIGQFELQAFIGRKDHGIKSIPDLVGKRIGVAFGTVSEFYIGRFLEINGVHLDDVTLVNVDPANSVEEITSGNVDGLIIWQPYAYLAKEQVGANAVVWPVQSGQRLYVVEVAQDEWIMQHPAVVVRFLESLAQAEQYYSRNSNQATLEMQLSLNYTDAYMAAIWNKNEYSLSLDEALVVAMEDEARWLIRNNLANTAIVPNFLDYIYFDGLASVKPESVNVIT